MFSEPKICVITTRATESQVREMLSFYGTVIKLAVDLERGILAGGGDMHADCESALLQIGSRGDDVWGANWTPGEQRIEYEALINIRARLGNRTMLLQDPAKRQRLEQIVLELLGGVYP